MKTSTQIAIALGALGAAAYGVYLLLRSPEKAKDNKLAGGSPPAGGFQVKRLQLGGDGSGIPTRAADLPNAPPRMTSPAQPAATYAPQALAILQQLQIAAVARNNPFMKFLLDFNLSVSPENFYDPSQLQLAIAEYQARSGLPRTGLADAATVQNMQNYLAFEKSSNIDYNS